MNNEKLLYIEDANNRKLFYDFTPAAIVSNFVPLIVILHEAGNSEIIDFEYKMWNILRPIDDFGFEHKGSSWLGEKGNFFVKDLLQKLISEIAQEHECEEHIYLYGSGMGGYGAILHGSLCKANAVYADTPPINLKTTVKIEFYKHIFSVVDTKENDLNNLLNQKDSFPIFYLCDNLSSTEGTKEIEGFVDTCKKLEIKVHLEKCPQKEVNETKALTEVLKFFEKMASQS